MFDIGFLEMMTIGIVALVVIGPERLPEVAAKVGRYIGKAQRFVKGVRSDISRELETGDLKQLLGDQKNQIDELRQMVHSATKDIESSTSGAMKDAQNSIGDIKKDIADSSGLKDSGKSESRIDSGTSTTNSDNASGDSSDNSTTTKSENSSQKSSSSVHGSEQVTESGNDASAKPSAQSAQGNPQS